MRKYVLLNTANGNGWAVLERVDTDPYDSAECYYELYLTHPDKEAAQKVVAALNAREAELRAIELDRAAEDYDAVEAAARRIRDQQ